MNELISPTTTPPAAPTLKPQLEAPVITGVESNVIFSDENTHIEINYHHDPEKQIYLDTGTTFIKTKDKSDTINITVGADNKLTAYINGIPHALPIDANDTRQALFISSSGGDNTINIDPRAQIVVNISTGKGKDCITAGGGHTLIDAGAGKDYIQLGSGTGIANGGDDDDILVAGEGHAIMSGDNGNDKLYATQTASTKRQIYLNGDNGDDELYAGAGINVLNGGLGNDTLVGHRQTTFYTGAGKNTVYSYSEQDKIHAQDTDTVHNIGNAPIEHVKHVDSGKHAFKIEGSPAFISKVENYLEQLRGSPSGQKLLQELDRLAIKNGGRTTIKESSYDGLSYYQFKNSHTDKVPEEEHHKHNSPEFGYITNGKAGSVATHAEIGVDAAYFSLDINEPPLLQLYHQMVHAFNGGHGTVLPGSQPVIGADGKPVEEDGEPKTNLNVEYQAIGIPTDGTLYDFDNNPMTPPTATNPSPYTENDMRREMGVPLSKVITPAAEK
ncbi:M91 family zinc metallopeptidase [Pseudomonas sp. L1(2025)]|uniref:M91 family zinc metallopeptidase n=1 Tax=Pseudomonas sp. L1(2025) TaxID=3449429 RepID=UPI003F692AD8